jgi:hypothetical protein
MRSSGALYGAAACSPTQNLILHQFNDLVGFAEVYWDCGTRVMVDFYFHGDSRTRVRVRGAEAYPGNYSKQIRGIIKPTASV